MNADRVEGHGTLLHSHEFFWVVNGSHFYSEGVLYGTFLTGTNTQSAAGFYTEPLKFLQCSELINLQELKTQRRFHVEPTVES